MVKCVILWKLKEEIENKVALNVGAPREITGVTY